MTEETEETTEGSALSKQTKTLEEQQREIDKRTDEEVAAREARARPGIPTDASAGELAPTKRHNPIALAEVPEAEARAQSIRSSYLATTPASEQQTSMRYHCMSCGWNKTLEFDPDDPVDAQAIEDGLANYGGPCPAEGCGYMTLVPHDGLGHHETFNDLAMQQKAHEAGVMADAVIDRIEQRAGDVILGPAARAAAEAGEGHEADAPDPSVSGELPDDASEA